MCYPAEEFSGSKTLKDIRISINVYKDGFIRVAANFIGVNVCPANHYFLETPYHRFSIEKAETYHRSAKNPLASLIGEASRRKDIKLSGTDISHLGHYLHPHIALGQYLKSNFLEKELDKKAIEKVFGSGKLYDLLLQYKRETCKYIINKYSKNENDVCLYNNYLKPGFYHNYPCVMVFVGEDARLLKFSTESHPSDAAIEAWANVLISFFTALVHYYTKCEGLNIELTRRSSFGFLTPTIAPCGSSFRINVGLIPKQYADVLINSLKTLNKILKIINDSYEKFDTALPDEVFFKNKHYKNYKKVTYKIPTNLLELIFFKAESKGKTTIQTLMKTALARDTLMCDFFNALCEPNKDINQTKTKASYFLSTLRDNFLKIKLIEKQNKYKLSYLQAQEPRLIPRDLAKFGLAKINDDCFWEVVSSLADLAEKELLFLPNTNVLLEDVKKAANRTLIMIRKCIEKSNIVYQEYNHTELVIENNYLIEKSIFFDENLFFNLELLGELLFSQAVILDKETKEEYGSDSDIEEKEEKKLLAVLGQKIIVQNGMRAIIATMLVSAEYLDIKKPKLFLQGAYFQTEHAVKLLKKFNEVNNIKDADIVVLDVNPCITDGKCFPANITKSAINNTKVLIADSTSATTDDHQKCIKQFRMSETAEVMFFVSSGLKNEQIGIDKNTYGTIRIFTKNKNSLEKIVGEIKKEEVSITSSIAHGFRRMLKRMGCVPTNASILKLDQTHTTQDLTLTSHYSPKF